MCEDASKPDENKCPFHAAVVQKAKLEEKFGELVHTDGFTFAPGPDGEIVSKPRMVKSIQKTAHVAGLRLKDDEGRDIHTGHIFRIGGHAICSRTA